MSYIPKIVQENTFLIDELKKSFLQRDLAKFQSSLNKLVNLAESNEDLYVIYAICTLNQKYNPELFEKVLTSEFSNSPHFIGFEKINETLDSNYKQYIEALSNSHYEKKAPKLIAGIIITSILAIIMLFFTFIDFSVFPTLLFFLVLDLFFIVKIAKINSL